MAHSVERKEAGSEYVASPSQRLQVKREHSQRFARRFSSRTTPIENFNQRSGVTRPIDLPHKKRARGPQRLSLETVNRTSLQLSSQTAFRPGGNVAPPTEYVWR